MTTVVQMPSAAGRRAMLSKIHIAQKDLGLTRDSYEDLLQRVAGVRSAAKCSNQQLDKVLAEFRRLGFRPKPKRKRAGRNRPLADQPLARKVRALWLSLWNLGEVEDPSEDALAAFVKRQTGLDDTRFLRVDDANKVIEALKAWCDRIGFHVPTRSVLDRINKERAQAGMPPLDGGFAAKITLIDLQWRKLISERAMRLEFARLETFLRKNYGVAAPLYLDSEQADRVIAELGDWLRSAMRAAAEGEQ